MPANRTHEVDFIRLVALLGICMGNIPVMGVSDGMADDSFFGLVTEPINQYAKFVTGLLVDGKFIILFSFIFGWGIAVQEKRITTAGGDFKRYYFRRSIGLMLLGVLHMVLVFDGDILLVYGITSMFFWSLRGYVLRTPVKRFLWQMVRYQYMVLALVIGFLGYLVSVTDIGGVSMLLAGNDELGGSFGEATTYRLFSGSIALILSLFTFTFHALAAFGLGYLAEHSGFFREGSDSFQRLRELLPKLLIFGIVSNVFYALGVSELVGETSMLVGMLLWMVGAPALAAVYLYFFVIIARRIQLPELFILAGRNSLSVYVLQGVIASLMFGGYGLGWFGEFGELALIPISIGIYFATVVIVGLYAKRYGRGFLEPVLRGISKS